MFTAESIQRLYKHNYDKYPLDLRFCKLVADKFNALIPRDFTDEQPIAGQAVLVYDPQDDAWFVLHYNEDFDKWSTRPRYTRWLPLPEGAQDA